MVFIKICVLTLGCKVNTYESEVIKNQFIETGDELVNIKDNPDVVIINTCTVTNAADAKSRKLIRSAKKSNEKAIVVVCGCSSEQYKQELLPLGIDILIGNENKNEVFNLVKSYLKNQKQIIKFDNQESFIETKVDNYTSQTRAFVKIQDGCNNYCSYCIIPFVRGRQRSKDLNTAFEEIKALVNNGFKEIVLTGIHTGSYGAGKDYNLITLIKMISKLENLLRIRISSIEITEIDNEFLEELANNPKICDHLHIPLQSGSDQVLKAMNRKYTIQEYIAKIKQIRTVRPLINLTTDLILGFPTESEEDFKITLDNLKELSFSKIHAFPYSERNGTVAADLKTIVNDLEKKLRVKKVLELSQELEIKYYQKFIGKSLELLIEEVTGDNSIGHTSNYIKVNIQKKLTKNEQINVIINTIDETGVQAVLSK